MRGPSFGSYGSLFVGALVLAILGAPVSSALAEDGDARINVTDPKKSGTIKVTIKCKRPDKTVEEVSVSVPIEADDDEDDKANKIADAIDAQNPSCFSVNKFGDGVDIQPKDDGGKIIDVDTEDDGTRETLGHRVESSERVEGRASFEGEPQGGRALLAVDELVASTPTGDQPVDVIMAELVLQLQELGLRPVLQDGEVRFRDDLANRELRVGADDPGLRQNLQVVVVESVPALPGVAWLGAALLVGLTVLALRRGSASH